MFVHCCHCSWCQRETGTAFALNAMIEADRVELTSGEVELVHTPSASGKGQKIWRCPECRVALWSNYSGSGDKVRFMRVGTLDTPADVVARAMQPVSPDRYTAPPPSAASFRRVRRSLMVILRVQV